MQKFTKKFLLATLFSGLVLSNTASAALDEETLKKIDTASKQYCELYWPHGGELVYNFFNKIATKFKAKRGGDVHNAIEKFLVDTAEKAAKLTDDAYMERSEFDAIYSTVLELRQIFRNNMEAYVDRKNMSAPTGIRSIEFSKDYIVSKCVDHTARDLRREALRGIKGDIDIDNPTLKSGDFDLEKKLLHYFDFVEKNLWNEK